MQLRPLRWWARAIAALVIIVGLILVVLAPLIGDRLSDSLWTVEPLAFIGALLLIGGMAVASLSYLVPDTGTMDPAANSSDEVAGKWRELTQQYFDLFNHDIGRPLRRIVGKERELQANIRLGSANVDSSVIELLEEIEAQAPNFRLMMFNIQALVQLEGPQTIPDVEPIEPSEVLRRIVERYNQLAGEAHKEISWWAEPPEFGIVMTNSPALEDIVANLVDNAVRYAECQVEVRLTRNPSHFFIRVWDDGPGIAPQHMPHIFDRGWTPEVARREEKSSSGLGLYIARTMARGNRGEITVESTPSPDPDHHTAFLVSLPLNAGEANGT